mmetsp:Transcript_22310/g.33239  ORF Transcript_22310/g.33239 Transcript_22310/m.33239 type:complete len:1507 (-) Transcript_22310:166-4686(-)
MKIMKLSEKGQTKKALRLFISAPASMADMSFCRSAMNALAQQGDAESAIKAYERMKSLNIHPTLKVMNCLLNALRKSGKKKYQEEGWNYYQGMLTSGLRPDNCTLGTLNGICKDLGQWQRSVELIDTMIKYGLVGSEGASQTFNNAIHNCEMNGLLEKCMELFKMMIKFGVKRTFHTFNILLRGCSKRGAWRTAMLLFETMRADGFQISGQTLCLLISSLLRGKKHERAFIVLNDTLSALENSKLPEWFFSKIIASNDDNLRVAESIFKTMIESKFRPLSKGYNALLYCCSRVGDWEKAKTLVKEMVQKRVQITSDTYELFLMAYCKADKHLEGCEDLHSICKHDRKMMEHRLIHPLNRMLRTLIIEERWNLAIFVFNRWKFSYSLLSYKLALWACRPASRWKDALAIRKKLSNDRENRATKADQEFITTFFECLSPGNTVVTSDPRKRKLWEVASDIFDSLHKERIIRSTSIFNSLMRICFEGEQHGRVNALFKSMAKESVAMNQETYSILFEVCSAKRDWEGALTRLKEMDFLGIKKDTSLYNYVLGILLSQQQSGEVLRVCEGMINEDIDLDELSYCAMLDACVAVGNSDRAILMYEKFSKLVSQTKNEKKSTLKDVDALSHYALGAVMHSCIRTARWTLALDQLCKANNAAILSQVKENALQLMSIAHEGKEKALGVLAGLSSSIQKVIVCTVVSLANVSPHVKPQFKRPKMNSHVYNVVIPGLINDLQHWLAKSNDLTTILTSYIRKCRTESYRTFKPPDIREPNFLKFNEAHPKPEGKSKLPRSMLTKSGRKIVVVEDSPIGADISGHKIEKVSSKATELGLEVGDQIIAIDGEELSGNNDIELQKKTLPYTIELLPKGSLAPGAQMAPPPLHPNLQLPLQAPLHPPRVPLQPPFQRALPLPRPPLHPPFPSLIKSPFKKQPLKAPPKAAPKIPLKPPPKSPHQTLLHSPLPSNLHPSPKPQMHSAPKVQPQNHLQVPLGEASRPLQGVSLPQQIPQNRKSDWKDHAHHRGGTAALQNTGVPSSVPKSAPTDEAGAKSDSHNQTDSSAVSERNLTKKDSRNHSKGSRNVRRESFDSKRKDSRRRSSDSWRESGGSRRDSFDSRRKPLESRKENPNSRRDRADTRRGERTSRNPRREDRETRGRGNENDDVRRRDSRPSQLEWNSHNSRDLRGKASNDSPQTNRSSNRDQERYRTVRGDFESQEVVEEYGIGSQERQGRSRNARRDFESREDLQEYEISSQERRGDFIHEQHMDEQPRRAPESYGPLPNGWEMVRDPESGDVYYWNINTDETTWKRPRRVPPPPPKRSPPRMTHQRGSAINELDREERSSREYEFSRDAPRNSSAREVWNSTDSRNSRTSPRSRRQRDSAGRESSIYSRSHVNSPINEGHNSTFREKSESGNHVEGWMRPILSVSDMLKAAVRRKDKVGILEALKRLRELEIEDGSLLEKYKIMDVVRYTAVEMGKVPSIPRKCSEIIRHWNFFLTDSTSEPQDPRRRSRT